MSPKPAEYATPIDWASADEASLEGGIVIGKASVDPSGHTSVIIRTRQGDVAIYLDKATGAFRKVPVYNS